MKRITSKQIIRELSNKGFFEIEVLLKNPIFVHGVNRKGYIISFSSPCEINLKDCTIYGVEVLDLNIKCHRLNNALEYIKTIPSLTTYDE
jgi:hypothetical protein